MKKFKPDTKESRKKSYLGDLYSTHQPNRAPTPPPQTIKLQIKQEPNTTASSENSDSCQQNIPNSGVKRSDPYEFDDDMAAPNVSENINGDLYEPVIECLDRWAGTFENK